MEKIRIVSAYLILTALTGVILSSMIVSLEWLTPVVLGTAALGTWAVVKVVDHVVG